MRPELQRLHEQLTEIRAGIAAIGDAARTATNGWTVAQVLEHLAQAHALCGASMDEILDAAPDRAGDDPVRYSWLDRQFIKTMAGASFKVPVPAVFESGASGPEAKADCLAATDALLATIARADGKRLAGLRATSPFNPLLKFGLLA